MKYLKIKLFLIGVMHCNLAISQAPGDEDQQMLNNAKARDQKAIDDAVNGWWKESMKLHEQRVQWWRDAKFGMFIHWGIYSLPGGEWKGQKVSGYAEHLMRKEKISRNDYLQIAKKFNPVEFDADEWVQHAKIAGMKYFIITAKHHDGFAMYDSKISDFNVIKQTPWKHDPMMDLSKACKKHGLKFGFYYSHAFDWEHPDAPGNDWEYKNPGGDLNLYGGRNWYDLHPELLPKAIKYVNEKAIPQIRELISKYAPDILWFDTPHKLPLSENIRILKAIREIDPDVVVNGRLVRNANANFGDYKNTADRPAEFFPVEGDWEAIPTTNESYGYSKFDDSHKPVSFFVRLLAKAASRGGNLLMNIGPKGNGEFDIKDVEILKGIGHWLSKNNQSIFNTSATPLSLQSWGVTTMKPGLLYLHVFQWPPNGKLALGGLKSNISKAYILTDPEKKVLPVEFINAVDMNLTVPLKAPDSINTVIVLELKGDIETDPLRLVVGNVPTRLLAFEADLSGKGFNYGDGKAASYFVEGWKTRDQSISWTFRIDEPLIYKVIIKYVATPETAGIYRLHLGTLKVEDKIMSTEKGNEIITKDIGQVKLFIGTNELSLMPVEIQKSELMKLLEVQLIPVQ